MNHFTIISSTNRNDAKTFELASYYQSALNKFQINNTLLDLKNLPRDISFSALYEQSGKNKEFNKFIEPLYLSNKFIFIVPEYNGSFPGILKTFIDAQSYPSPFKGKKCALVGLSAGGHAASHALSHLTDIFNYLGMNSLSTQIRLSPIAPMFENNKFTNVNGIRLIDKQIQELISF